MTTVEYAAETTETTLPAVPAAPNGAAWAAILAAGIGCACFGLLADLTEVFPSVKKFCNFYNPSGDLSGKSTLAVVVWLAAWALSHFRWRSLSLKRAGWVAAFAILLVLASLAATFPPTFELLAGVGK